MKYEIMTYDEVKDFIKRNYDSTISEKSILKLTFLGATSRILDELNYTIETSEVEKIMIYTQLTLWGLENGEMCDDIRKEITEIITQDKLSRFGGKTDFSDFESIKTDLGKIKVQLNI